MKQVFGIRVPGRIYQPRPSAYVLAPGPAGTVAVVRSVDGCYLPGGGIEPGESPEAAALREVREECGAGARLGPQIAAAVQFAYSASERRYFEKRCVFFDAVLDDPQPASAEPGHELLWLSVDEAQRHLAHESHAWVVALWSQAIARSSGRT